MARITRQIIHTANAPAAVGPYSQAVRVDNTIYVSGSLGLDPKTGELKQGIKEQAHQSLKNIGEILKAAGVGYGNVVKTTVLLADINDFTTVNDIYKEYFTTKYPARAAYQLISRQMDIAVEETRVEVVDDFLHCPSGCSNCSIGTSEAGHLGLVAGKATACIADAAPALPVSAASASTAPLRSLRSSFIASRIPSQAQTSAGDCLKLVRLHVGVSINEFPETNVPW
ncbi:putative endoribonuclease L-PSP [Teladorsagia circumcincta]|uniref:Putative endoribonuclease L-PSP n=1 Tax=Teladorsagia circumcincta TaxID=45464 RepID=A0A2G9UKI5_TELCI|nr:putative endoribonuclease L-PSP [Teladorsagia circumcincta]